MTIEKLFALHADAKTKFILWIYYMVEKIYNVDINMIQNLIPKSKSWLVKNTHASTPNQKRLTIANLSIQTIKQRFIFK